jgi:hypothetical protein
MSGQKPPLSCIESLHVFWYNQDNTGTMAHASRRRTLMGPGTIGSSGLPPEAGHTMRLLRPQDLDGEIEALRLKEESIDNYIKVAEEELARRDKRCRMFVKLTDGAGNAVKPMAVASLIGMGFNPLWGLGLLASIATLATAFVFRKHLYDENTHLLKAHNDLQSLQDIKLQLEHQKAPLERQKKELDWLKKAAELAQDLHKDESSTISIDDEFVVIGGIKLKREKEDVK